MGQSLAITIVWDTHQVSHLIVVAKLCVYVLLKTSCVHVLLKTLDLLHYYYY